MRRSTTGPVPSIAVLALLLAATAGCQSGSRPLSDYDRETGDETIEVRDDWREYALAHYAGELLVELQNATDVRFIHPPAVTATRNARSGQVQLIVLGQLDQTNRQGNRLRHPYYVSWAKSGGGWKLLDRHIQPGKTAPPAPKPFDAPPAGPATVPGQ